MTNLSQKLRARLKKEYPLTVIKSVEVKESTVDGTRKYLFELGDGQVIESVWMNYHHGCTVCISSQVGCRMGCGFCASTIHGLIRNLTAAEMLEQVYRVGEHTEERVTNIVMMGMGEPLDNYQQVIRFLNLIGHERGAGISLRNITVSTCGIVPAIYQLAEEKLPVTLALSLHAPTDEKRQSLMPVAKKYTLSEVIKACSYYYEKTKRRLTFEYSLVAGNNDFPEDAKMLSQLIRGLNCHVNLIPINPVKERNYYQSNKKNVEKFKNKLEKYGINVTIRREMGRDIDGACGQLRMRYLDQDLRECER
jgi:23S rRNA (adenine2503-C2)-methyltransferase